MNIAVEAWVTEPIAEPRAEDAASTTGVQEAGSTTISEVILERLALKDRVTDSITERRHRLT